jgi:hypothetical protein
MAIALIVAILFFFSRPADRSDGQVTNQEEISDLSFNFKIKVFDPTPHLYYANEPPVVQREFIMFREVVGGHIRIFSGFQYTVEVLKEGDTQ